MGRITGYFQPPRYDEQVQVGYDGEHDARQGNGDSQDDQALEDVLDAFLLECRPVDGEGPLQLIIVIDQDQPGCKPTGAGAEMRQSLGSAVFFGMLGVTLFGLFLTPVFYVTLRKLVTRRKPVQEDLPA